MKDIYEDDIKQSFLQILKKLVVGKFQMIDPFIADLKGINSKGSINKVLDLEEQIEKLKEQEQILNKLLSSGYIEMDSFYMESNQLKSDIENLNKEKLRLSNNLNGNLIHLNEAQKLRRFIFKT